MTVRAKFRCFYVYRSQDGKTETAQLHAVYSSDPADPNYTWSTATPGGNLTMTISNPAAFGLFEQGKEYFLDFTPAT